MKIFTLSHINIDCLLINSIPYIECRANYRIIKPCHVGFLFKFPFVFYKIKFQNIAYEKTT